MNKKFADDNRGVSLLELIITLAISAIVIVSAYSFVIVGMKSYKKTKETTTLQSEVSFANNIIGEAIREAIPSKTQITTYTSGNVELYTGNKVIYYVPSSKSIYVFDVDPAKSAGTDAYGSGAKFNNLVTEYADEFSISFVEDTSKEIETNPDGTEIPDSRRSNVINVKIKITYKGKSDTTDVNYYIRSNG